MCELCDPPIRLVILVWISFLAIIFAIKWVYFIPNPKMSTGGWTNGKLFIDHVNRAKWGSFIWITFILAANEKQCITVGGRQIDWASFTPKRANSSTLKSTVQPEGRRRFVIVRFVTIPGLMWLHVVLSHPQGSGSQTPPPPFFELGSGGRDVRFSLHSWFKQTIRNNRQTKRTHWPENGLLDW